MIRTSRLPSSMVALHETPRHSRLSDYMGLWGKKYFQWGLRFIISCILYLSLSRDISIRFVIWSVTRTVMRPGTVQIMSTPEE